MKIAVAALTDTPSTRVSSNPARAPYFLLFNEQGGFVEVVRNPFRWGGGTKGYGIGSILRDNMVDTLIAGKFRKELQDTLRDYGLTLMEGEGTIRKSIEDLLSMAEMDAELDTIKS